MSIRESYSPGPANVAHVEKDGEIWTLVLVREFRHSPARVWEALTDPEQLRQWSPFESDGNMGTTGAMVKITTVGAPAEYAVTTTIAKAEAPKTLQYKFGDFDTRWELEPNGEGTRLTLWTTIDRRYIAMGAAGWQIAFDVMESVLDGDPIGRITGPDAMKFEGWQRLHKEYAKQFHVETPTW